MTEPSLSSSLDAEIDAAPQDLARRQFLTRVAAISAVGWIAPSVLRTDSVLAQVGSSGNPPTPTQPPATTSTTTTAKPTTTTTSTTTTTTAQPTTTTTSSTTTSTTSTTTSTTTTTPTSGLPTPCTFLFASTGSRYVLCQGDATKAWFSSDRGTGSCSYPALAICQQYGYTTVTAWGGTCGTVCGYCNSNFSCASPQSLGSTRFDSGGGNPTTGSNLSCTVHWLCG